MSSPIYKPDKVYYLECGDKTWIFQYATLHDFHESKLTKMMCSSGAGKQNTVHLDYDPKVMDSIIREMKNFGCVDWRECGRTELNLASKYAHDLRLYDIKDQIETVLKLKEQLKKLSIGAIHNLLTDAKNVVKIPTESFNTLANLIFHATTWYFEDLETKESSNSTSTSGSRSPRRSRSRSGSRPRSRSRSMSRDKHAGESKRPLKEGERKDLPTISLASLVSGHGTSATPSIHGGAAEDLRVKTEFPLAPGVGGAGAPGAPGGVGGEEKKGKGKKKNKGKGK